MREKTPEVRRRLLLIGMLFLLFFALTIFFLAQRFFLGESQAPRKQEQTEDKPLQTDTFVGRKNIYDRNFQELAVSFRLASVYARPLELQDPKRAADSLAKILGLDENVLLDTLKAERSFVWLGRQIGPAKANAIADLNIKGVHLFDEVQRYYPNHQTAAHVVGFMKDEQGLAGVESYYDNVLRGGGLQDTDGSAIATGDSASVDDGKKDAHLILTLDLRMQSVLERELTALKKQSKATAAMAVIMEPNNGSIVALTNLPTYDPNRFWDYDTDERKNRVIADPVFPGEINRIFRLAAALELGQTLSPRALDEKIGDPAKPSYAGEHEQGAANENLNANWTQIDDGVYGSTELSAVIDQPVDEEDLAAFVKTIGLAGDSGIDLPEENAVGMIPELAEVASEYRLDGFVSSTAAISLLTAFSSLANGGNIVRPHLLEALWENGENREISAEQFSAGSVLQSGVSQKLLAMLREGSGLKQNSPLFFESLLSEEKIEQLNRKEHVDNEKRHSKDQRFHAVLLGFSPGNNQDIAMVVVLDDAQIKLESSSPLRQMGKRVISKLRRLNHEERLGSANISLEPREEENYKKWLALQNKKNDQFFLPQAQLKEKMPDVRGYSLRKALQVLQQYGLRLRVNGAGRVVTQHPVPGASLEGTEETVLELRMDQ